MISWLFDIVRAASDISISDAPTLVGSGAPTANNAVAAVLNRIAELMLVIAIPLAIIGVIYAAIALIRAAGKPDGYTNAKKYLLAVTTGIFLIVFAVIIVRLVYNLFQ